MGNTATPQAILIEQGLKCPKWCMRAGAGNPHSKKRFTIAVRQPLSRSLAINTSELRYKERRDVYSLLNRA
ncbi:hypothetical protein EON65_51930 [archaeon]|nr:MAG: hypothetical protein EON65_51930 [archaeon]